MTISPIKRAIYRLLPVSVVVQWPALSLSTTKDPIPMLRSYLRACNRLEDWLAANGYDEDRTLPRSQLPNSMRLGLCMFDVSTRPIKTHHGSDGPYLRLLTYISQEMGYGPLCPYIGRDCGPTPQRRECAQLLLDFLVPLRRSGLLEGLLNMEPRLAIQVLDEDELERARLVIECWNRGTSLDKKKELG